MIAEPEIRYAKDGDVYIAYQVLGGVESPDLLAFSSALLPIDSMNDEPSLARFHHRLASFRRLIRFDERGVGLSDSVTPSQPPTLEQWMQNALTVMDAAGSERAAVFAPRDSSLEAIFAGRHLPGPSQRVDLCQRHGSRLGRRTTQLASRSEYSTGS